MRRTAFTSLSVVAILLVSLTPSETNAANVKKLSQQRSVIEMLNTQPLQLALSPPSPVRRNTSYVLLLPDQSLQPLRDPTIYHAQEVQRQFSDLQQSHPQKTTGKRIQKIMDLKQRVNLSRLYPGNGYLPNSLSDKLLEINAPR